MVGTLAHTQRHGRARQSPLNVLRSKILDSSLSAGTQPRTAERTATINKSKTLPNIPRQRNVVLELADASLLTAREPGPHDVPENTTLLLQNRVGALQRERDKVLGVRESLADELARQQVVRAQSADAILEQKREVFMVNQMIKDYRASLKASEERIADASKLNQMIVRQERAQLGAEARAALKAREIKILEQAKVDMEERTLRNKASTKINEDVLVELRLAAEEAKLANATRRRVERAEAEESVTEARTFELSRLRTARDTLRKAEEATALRLAEKRAVVAERQRREYRAGRMEQFVSKQKAQVTAKKMEREQTRTLEALREAFEDKRELQTTLNKSVTQKTRLVEAMKEAMGRGDHTQVEQLKATLTSGAFVPKAAVDKFLTGRT